MKWTLSVPYAIFQMGKHWKDSRGVRCALCSFKCHKAQHFVIIIVIIIILCNKRMKEQENGKENGIYRKITWSA